jgi:hypothetical protein
MTATEDSAQDTQPVRVARRHSRPATGWRTRARGVPVIIWLAVVTQLFLGLAWSTLQLPYRSPDEPEHFYAALYLTNHHNWPDPGTLHESTRISQTESSQELSPAGSRAGTVAPRGQRATLAIHGKEQFSGRVDQMTQHPPLYYAAVAVVLRIIPGWSHWDYDKVLGLVRILSALLIAPVPLFLWLAARRLTQSRYLAIAGGLGSLLLPGLSRTAGSVTNDALEVLLTTIAGYGIVRILTGGNGRRTAWFTGIAAGLDLLTKGTALAVAGWLVLSYLWCRLRWRVPVWPAVWRCAIPTGIGLLWWLRNVVKFGSVQPAGYSPDPPSPATGGWKHFVSEYFSGVSFRFWGSFGIPEPPAFDRTLCQIATFVTIALLLVGLFGLRRAGGPGTALVLLFGTVGFLGIIVEGAFNTYRHTNVIAAEQGRYLYPAILPLILVAVAGMGVLLRGRLRVLVPLIVGVFAVLMQLAEVVDSLRATWAPTAGASVKKSFHQLFLWAPWPSIAIKAGWVVLVLASVGLCLAVLITVLRGLRNGDDALSPTHP